VLRMRLTPPIDTAAWKWDGKRWNSGSSWIEPYAHPAIEHRMIRVTTGSSCLVVREAVSQLDAPPWAEDPINWPLQAMAVTVTGCQNVNILAGERGVAPVYLRPSGRSLHASWDLLDLNPDAEDIEVREVTAILAYRARYSTATPFRSIRRLTERARATWASPPGQLRIRYPEPALHSRPRLLRPGADPGPVFIELVRNEISVRPLTADQCAVELSGGMDSTITALALSEAVGRVRTSALILDGDVGEQQCRRRAEIIDRGNLGSDIAIPASDYAPFHPASFRSAGQVSSPIDGTYVEAMNVLYAHLRAVGVRWLFTGIGGDELCFQRPEEREITGDPWNIHPIPDHLGPRACDALPSLLHDLAPSSALHASTLAALSVHSVTAMRHGLWPVSPLATPVVLRFAESLPLEWRRGKRLMRAWLESEGYSQEVVYPPLREDFAGICETAMLRYGFPLFRDRLPDSFLVGRGLLDAQTMRNMCNEIAVSRRRVSEIYRPLALECAFRSLG
jgi:asparagine synthase (glutamine-hydrolysing)